MPSKKHIAILSSYLNFPGGYERIVVETANLFAAKGLQVTLIILGETAESFYPLHKNIRVIQKPMHFGITKKGNMITRKIKFLKDLLGIKRLLKKLKASVVIATEYPFAVAAILCGAKKFSKIVSWEHTHYHGTKRNFFWKQLFKRTYPKLDSIVCLNAEEEAYFNKLSKVVVIPNFAENKTGNISPLDSKTILSVGSLIPRKGIDLLLQAAKEVLNEHKDWKWKLIGSGEMKEQVENFIRVEKLHQRFILQAPVSSNLDKEYLQASLFVLSSRSETLPMVLLEAISFGLPCISFDCPSGPSAIIRHKQDGLLVEKENPVKLAEAITSLIENEEQRKKMGANALKNAQRFSPETIYQLWEKEVFTL